ncbi:unnamed protein product [Amoebophrya sp. A120]|nr:unnamed protein product [Amoebophrya sp. A120]|eukprot:GSA120T00018913001.1
MGRNSRARRSTSRSRDHKKKKSERRHKDRGERDKDKEAKEHLKVEKEPKEKSKKEGKKRRRSRSSPETRRSSVSTDRKKRRAAGKEGEMDDFLRSVPLTTRARRQTKGGAEAEESPKLASTKFGDKHKIKKVEKYDLPDSSDDGRRNDSGRKRNRRSGSAKKKGTQEEVDTKKKTTSKRDDRVSEDNHSPKKERHQEDRGRRRSGERKQRREADESNKPLKGETKLRMDEVLDTTSREMRARARNVLDALERPLDEYRAGTKKSPPNYRMRLRAFECESESEPDDYRRACSQPITIKPRRPPRTSTARRLAEEKRGKNYTPERSKVLEESRAQRARLRSRSRSRARVVDTGLDAASSTPAEKGRTVDKAEAGAADHVETEIKTAGVVGTSNPASAAAACATKAPAEQILQQTHVGTQCDPDHAEPRQKKPTDANGLVLWLLEGLCKKEVVITSSQYRDKLIAVLQEVEPAVLGVPVPAALPPCVPKGSSIKANAPVLQHRPVGPQPVTFAMLGSRLDTSANGVRQKGEQDDPGPVVDQEAAKPADDSKHAESAQDTSTNVVVLPPDQRAKSDCPAGGPKERCASSEFRKDRRRTSFAAMKIDEPVNKADEDIAKCGPCPLPRPPLGTKSTLSLSAEVVHSSKAKQVLSALPIGKSSSITSASGKDEMLRNEPPAAPPFSQQKLQEVDQESFISSSSIKQRAGCVEEGNKPKMVVKHGDAEAEKIPAQTVLLSCMRNKALPSRRIFEVTCSKLVLNESFEIGSGALGYLTRAERVELVTGPVTAGNVLRMEVARQGSRPVRGWVTSGANRWGCAGNLVEVFPDEGNKQAAPTSTTTSAVLNGINVAAENKATNKPEATSANALIGDKTTRRPLRRLSSVLRSTEKKAGSSKISASSAEAHNRAAGTADRVTRNSAETSSDDAAVAQAKPEQVIALPDKEPNIQGPGNTVAPTRETPSASDAIFMKLLKTASADGDEAANKATTTSSAEVKKGSGAGGSNQVQQPNQEGETATVAAVEQGAAGGAGIEKTEDGNRESTASASGDMMLKADVVGSGDKAEKDNKEDVPLDDVQLLRDPGGDVEFDLEYCLENDLDL